MTPSPDGASCCAFTPLSSESLGVRPEESLAKTPLAKTPTARRARRRCSTSKSEAASSAHAHAQQQYLSSGRRCNDSGGTLVISSLTPSSELRKRVKSAAESAVAPDESAVVDKGHHLRDEDEDEASWRCRFDDDEDRCDGVLSPEMDLMKRCVTRTKLVSYLNDEDEDDALELRASRSDGDCRTPRLSLDVVDTAALEERDAVHTQLEDEFELRSSEGSRRAAYDEQPVSTQRRGDRDDDDDDDDCASVCSRDLDDDLDKASRDDDDDDCDDDHHQYPRRHGVTLQVAAPEPRAPDSLTMRRALIDADDPAWSWRYDFVNNASTDDTACASTDCDAAAAPEQHSPQTTPRSSTPACRLDATTVLAAHHFACATDEEDDDEAYCAQQNCSPPLLFDDFLEDATLSRDSLLRSMPPESALDCAFPLAPLPEERALLIDAHGVPLLDSQAVDQATAKLRGTADDELRPKSRPFRRKQQPRRW